MTNHKKVIICRVLFFISIILFFFIKFKSPAFVEYVFTHSAVLERTHSLDFYLGKAEDIIFGPLSSLLSGVLLLGFCLVYMRKASRFHFGATIFLYLLVTRPEVLSYPPFGDSLVAVFSDVVWLLRNSFDYVSYVKLGNYSTAGPQVYLTSIYPSFLAFLVFLMPSVKVFLIVIHTLVFGMAAVIVVVFREILKEVFDDDVALISSVLLVSLPLFQCMVELINLEMACLLFAILAVYYLFKRNIVGASIMGILSSIMKDPGSIACFLVFAVSAVLYVIDKDNNDRMRNLIWGAIGITIVTLKYMARKLTIVEQSGHNNFNPLVGLENIKTMSTFWIFLVLLAVFIIYGVVWWMRQEQGTRTLRRWIDEHYAVSIVFTMTAMYYLLYMNFSVMVPRYKLLLAPFLIFCIIYIFALLVKNKHVFKSLLVCTVLFIFVCSHGLVYGSHYGYPHEYNVYERSLEYRNSLKLHMKITKEIEDNFSNFTVSAPIIELGNL